MSCFLKLCENHICRALILFVLWLEYFAVFFCTYDFAEYLKSDTEVAEDLEFLSSPMVFLSYISASAMLAFFFELFIIACW